MHRLRFEGTYISVQDFVDRIYDVYKLNERNTCLELRNLYSHRLYADPEELLRKNSGVEIVRLPVPRRARYFER